MKEKNTIAFLFPTEVFLVLYMFLLSNNIIKKISKHKIWIISSNRNFYKQNPRPDALMKEQIVEMSGLSPRVIRVWFQNKRCKDKKTQIKQELQQERVRENYLKKKLKI